MSSKSYSNRVRANFARCFATAALVAFSLAAQAQPAGMDTAGIDPAAQRLLKTSLDFLASQNQFSVDTRNSLEVVLYSGQKIQFNHTARQSIQRPNKLRVERTGDLVQQVFVYDGRSLTLYNPGDNMYATVAAPDTLEAMLDFARKSLDIVAPAGDLLYKNGYEILMEDVMSGFVVGKAVIEGVRCDHLAFRTPVTDWQIWIQEGAQPLPRKIVITTRDVFNAPEFSVTTTKWDLQPRFNDQTFNFAPPRDAKKVDFLPR
jgi:hypothetical protein